MGEISRGSLTVEAANPVAYAVDLAEADSHLVTVEAVIWVEGRESIELFMPVWTPGSYLVREYSRHVERIEVVDAGGGAGGAGVGTAVRISKVRKNAWRVDWPGPVDSVTVRYSLYCRERSVRTNWADGEYVFLAGAATFLTAAEHLAMPHRVELRNVPAAHAAACPLPPSGSGVSSGYAFAARDFDSLVDSPILVGELRERSFEAGGRPHRLISTAEADRWDYARAAQDTARVVEEVQRFWGEVPYERYDFLNLIVGGYGGLEHDDCCVLVADRWQTREREAYLKWLGLVCHEFFHTWNVRRLRPRTLARYDYEAEQYFEELWVAEGVTSYFDDLLLRRGGLCDEAEYLKLLSGTIAGVMNAPGRLLQSLADSSRDTWIKLYRPDENAANSRMSYYTKGALVAWLLDFRLRELTGHAATLDEVMRTLWRRCRGSGYSIEDFEATVAEHSPGGGWPGWFEAMVRGVGELEFDAALRAAGLRWKPAAEAGAVMPGSLDFETKNVEGRLVIAKLVRGGAAWAGGLRVDDELISVDDFRATPSNFGELLKGYPPGSRVRVEAFRRDRRISREVVLSPSTRAWLLEVDPEAAEPANEFRRRWLGGEPT